MSIPDPGDGSISTIIAIQTTTRGLTPGPSTEELVLNAVGAGPTCQLVMSSIPQAQVPGSEATKLHLQEPPQLQ